MGQTAHLRTTPRRVITGRIAIAAVAVSGLSASLLAVDGAGATTRHASKHLVVSTVKSTKLGTFLVSGKTVYILSKVGKVACTTTCLKTWPEVLLPNGVTKATAGTGVSAAKLGTVARSDGVLQVTYAGKPLYFFSGDKAAGQVKGNVTDTWGTWSVVVTVKPTTSSSGSGGGTGGNSATAPATAGTSTTTTPTTTPDRSPTPTTTIPSSGGVAF